MVAVGVDFVGTTSAEDAAIVAVGVNFVGTTSAEDAAVVQGMECGTPRTGATVVGRVEDCECKYPLPPCSWSPPGSKSGGKVKDAPSGSKVTNFALPPAVVGAIKPVDVPVNPHAQQAWEASTPRNGESEALAANTANDTPHSGSQPPPSLPSGVQ